jgi:hypothetical protein
MVSGFLAPDPQPEDLPTWHRWMPDRPQRPPPRPKGSASKVTTDWLGWYQYNLVLYNILYSIYIYNICVYIYHMYIYIMYIYIYIIHVYSYLLKFLFCENILSVYEIICFLQWGTSEGSLLGGSTDPPSSWEIPASTLVESGSTMVHLWKSCTYVYIYIYDSNLDIYIYVGVEIEFGP